MAMSIFFLWRLDLVIVTYKVWTKMPESFFRLHEANEVLSFSPGLPLVVFMANYATGKGRIDELSNHQRSCVWNKE